MNRRQQLIERRHFVTQWMLDNYWRLVEEGKSNPERTRRKFDQVHRLTACIRLDICIYDYEGEPNQ